MIKIRNNAFRVAVTLAAVASMMGTGTAQAARSSFYQKALQKVDSANVADAGAGKAALEKAAGGQA
jgi:hypothetical protein